MAISVPTSLHWYQVVCAGAKPGQVVRGRVQADNPDVALREVMRVNRLSFTVVASIYRLGSHGAPSRRQNVRVRLPRVEGVQHG